MQYKFNFYEVVIVIGDVVTRTKNRRLQGEIGIVLGRSEPDADGKISYAVHFNSYGESMVVSENDLATMHRMANGNEIVSRSRQF
jgi:hypothetical protein